MSASVCAVTIRKILHITKLRADELLSVLDAALAGKDSLRHDVTRAVLEERIYFSASPLQVAEPVDQVVENSVAVDAPHDETSVAVAGASLSPNRSTEIRGSRAASVRADIVAGAVNEAPEFEHGFATQDATFDGVYQDTFTGRKVVLGDAWLSVKTSETYELSVSAFAGDGQGGGSASNVFHYLGFASYDIDDHHIGSQHYLKHVGSTDTTLAADLNPGDQQIILTDATGWYDGDVLPRASQRRSLAWYGYQDSTGHTYADYTYTRNVALDLWDENSISGNVITLRKPWDGPALSAGDAVRNARTGGTFDYPLASGQVIPQSETAYSVTIGGGEITDGLHSRTLFRPGTVAIRALVLANYTPIDAPSDTTSLLTVNNFEIRTTSGPYLNGVTTFVEDGGPIDLLDVNAAIHDVDSDFVESVTMELTNGKVGDVLRVNEEALNTLGISIGGIPVGPLTTDGIITVHLTADIPESISKTDFVAALRSVKFENVSEGPDSSDRFITFVANDGQRDSAADTLAVRIVAVNDAPGWRNLNSGIEYLENQSGELLQPSIEITDSDSADFRGGEFRVTVGAGGDPSDWLRILPNSTVNLQGTNVVVNGITIGTYSGGHGADDLVVSLNGNATAIHVSQLAQRIAYANTSDSPNLASKVIAFSVRDGDGGASSLATTNVAVSPVEEPPIARDDGSSLHFDGVDDFVAIPDAPSLRMTDSLTMEAWFKADGHADATSTIILNKEGEYEIGIGPNGHLIWAFANSTPGWSWHDTGFQIALGEWTHVAVTYDAGEVYAYVNGNLVDAYYGSGSIGDQYPSMNELRIGGRLNNPAGQHFDGQIDEVRVWDVVRSARAIRAGLDASVSPTSSGLVGHWKFEPFDGNFATDRSGNENHGQHAAQPASTTPLWQVYTVAANESLSITSTLGPLANDLDPDGDALRLVSIDMSHTQGSVTIDSLGSLTYDPNGAFNFLSVAQRAYDTVIYTIEDTNGNLASATIMIQIRGVDDPGEPGDQVTDDFVAPPPLAPGGDADNPNNDDGGAAGDGTDDTAQGSDSSSNPTTNPPTAVPGGLGQSVAAGGDGLTGALHTSQEKATSSEAETVDDEYVLALILDDDELSTHVHQRLQFLTNRNTLRADALATSDFRTLTTASLTQQILSLVPFDGNAVTEDEPDANVQELIVGTTAVVSSALSVGYVIWLIRGGAILASVISTLPSWVAFDPLPILESARDLPDDVHDTGLVGLTAGVDE